VLVRVPSVRADDEPTPAEKQRDQNNLKQLGLACHNYLSATNHFPRNITDKDGKLLLSWRVAILPYIEEEALYKQFKLDEPWDSEQNKKLSEKMPKVFAPVRGKVEKTPPSTRCSKAKVQSSTRRRKRVSRTFRTEPRTQS
jgi:hypothetical protein